MCCLQTPLFAQSQHVISSQLSSRSRCRFLELTLDSGNKKEIERGGGRGESSFVLLFLLLLRLLTSHGAMVKGCLVCIYREKKKVCVH